MTGCRLALLLLLPALASCAPDFAASPTAAGPARIPSAERVDGDRLVVDDGTALPLQAWLPEDEAGAPARVRAVIVAAHGFNDHKSAFELPAAVWRRHGIATYAYDQRGFGANPNAGRWPGSRTLALDFAAAIRAVRLRHPGVPVYGLGESMGGAVALVATAETGPAKPDGVILVAPAVWGRATETLAERVALFLSVRIIPSVTFTGRGFGVQASDNIPMLRELSRDPLFIKDTRVDSIDGLVDLMDDAVAAAPSFRRPALLLYGAHDELIPRDAMRKLIRALPLCCAGPQRLAYYRNGWHMLLRDLEHEWVADDIVSWIDNHAAPLPSGASAAAATFLNSTDSD